MNKQIEIDEQIGVEDALDLLSARIEGLTAGLFALTHSLKNSGAIDKAVLESKIENALMNTSVRNELKPLFELPLLQIRWAMSDLTPEDELRVFGDLKVHAPDGQQDG